MAINNGWPVTTTTHHCLITNGIQPTAAWYQAVLNEQNLGLQLLAVCGSPPAAGVKGPSSRAIHNTTIGFLQTTPLKSRMLHGKQRRVRMEAPYL